MEQKKFYCKELNLLSSDKRGIVFFSEIIMKNINNISDYHIATITAGNIRGNHYHSKTDEILLCWGSEFHLKTALSDKIIFDKKLNAENSVFELFIPQGITHAIQNISNNILNLFCIYMGDFNNIRQDMQQHIILGKD